MVIELPGFLARLYNIMGGNWTNSNEGIATRVSGESRQYAAGFQQPVGDAAEYRQRLGTAVEGEAGDAMNSVMSHPQGAIANLTDHYRGILVAAMLFVVASMMIRAVKEYKIINGARTVAAIGADLATATLDPAAEVNLAEILRLGELGDKAATNYGMQLMFGGGFGA
jgi:hypothetical protein